MGRTIKKLSSRQISSEAIFNNRFVVELCEAVHIHYRNLRILLSLEDFLSMAEGMANALDRWKKLGSPEPSASNHIELCRKKVSGALQDPSVNVNHNENLYRRFKGRVFSEGTDFEDPTYIHFKLWDQRIEMRLKDFKELAQAVKEADQKLEECYD